MNFIIPSFLEIVLVYYILNRDRVESLQSYIFTLLGVGLIIFGCVTYVYQFPFKVKHSGIIPSIVLPISIILELRTIYSNPNSDDVDTLTIASWVLISLGLFGCYILAGRYTSFETNMSFMVPNLLTIWAIWKLTQQYLNQNKKQES